MPILIIDTATIACSVALVEGGTVIAEAHEITDRGHAERLIPMIAGLPGGGRADHILVDCGPGSFTGIRVGIAAARGLALGWGATIAGYSSLALLAAAEFARDAALADLAVIIEGGHGEVFMQRFEMPPFAPASPLASLRPDAALAMLGAVRAIGNGVRHLAALDAGRDLAEALPRASDARLLPDAFRQAPPTPIYGRAPDAKPAMPPMPAMPG